MTLVEFLLARVAEDEEFASEAVQRPWLANDNFVDDTGDGSVARFEIKADARHATVWDPPRVLAECQARRAILESFRRVDVEARSRGVVDMDRPEGEDLGVLAVAAALQGVVRVLAQPFKDHPDFDPAWSLD